MELRKLNKLEFIRVYAKHMVRDFPLLERKPCSVILRGMTKKTMLAFGGFEKGRLLCYAVLVLREKGQPCLLDYLAVVPKHRGKGIGSATLRLLKDMLPEYSGVLIEYEDPNVSCAEQEARKRRENFYLQNHVRRTGLCADVFSVPFRIGYLPFARDISDGKLQNQLDAIYTQLGYGKNYTIKASASE